MYDRVGASVCPLFSYWLLVLYYLLVPGSSYWFDSLFSYWLLILYYLLVPGSSYWFGSLFSYIMENNGFFEG